MLFYEEGYEYSTLERNFFGSLLFRELSLTRDLLILCQIKEKCFEFFFKNQFYRFIYTAFAWIWYLVIDDIIIPTKLWTMTLFTIAFHLVLYYWILEDKLGRLRVLKKSYTAKGLEFLAGPLFNRKVAVFSIT